MAIISLFRSISLVSGVIFCRSLPAISGEASMHQSEKWVLYSSSVIPPFPTSSISGSFHLPGPAYLARSLCLEKISIMLFQLSLMSPVVLQRWPTSPAHSHGLLDPHSQMLNTIGLPAVCRASLIFVYDDFASCDP